MSFDDVLPVPKTGRDDPPPQKRHGTITFPDVLPIPGREPDAPRGGAAPRQPPAPPAPDETVPPPPPGAAAQVARDAPAPLDETAPPGAAAQVARDAPAPLDETVPPPAAAHAETAPVPPPRPGTPVSGSRPQTTVPYDGVLATPDHATIDAAPPGAEGPDTSGSSGPPVAASSQSGEGAPPVRHTTIQFQGVLPVPREGASLRATSDDDGPQPGEVVGGYTLGEVVVARATGAYFAVMHPEHGACLLQVLSAPVAIARGPQFLVEARVRTRLEAPRVVRALDVGHEPRPWVLMPRIQGRTLREELDARQRLTSARVGRLARDVARGLAALHQRRLVHGDLQAGDVLLSGEGPQLAGLGVPKAYGRSGERLAHEEGAGLGPAPHAAPELLAGGKPSPASDVYAVGALLFEGLSGEPPFAGDASEVLDAVLEGPPTAPKGLDRTGEALAEVALVCLARDPGERYGSAAALLEALEAIVPEAAAPASRGLWGAIRRLFGSGS